MEIMHSEGAKVLWAGLAKGSDPLVQDIVNSGPNYIPAENQSKKKWKRLARGS